MEIDINAHMEPGMNIGGLLQKYIANNPSKTFTKVLLQVGNGNWYGSFTVPFAVGFSTPLFLCKDGILKLLNDSSSNDDLFLHLYNWSNIFSGKACRKDDVFTFTSIHGSCVICDEEYKSGDNLIRLEGCGHVYHLQCQKKWAFTGKTKLDLAISAIDGQSILSPCPVCRKSTA